MIGVFDSGLGGLTVVREIMKQLPGHDVVYFGDTARNPYGTKGERAIKRFAVEDAKLLESVGADIIIIACNTASAVAADEVKKAVGVPVIDVVMPTVRAVYAMSERKIGVIGTPATISSGVYEKNLNLGKNSRLIFSQACPLFVPLVEEGWLRNPETEEIAKRYLSGLKFRHVESLILGCTHYPFLRPIIRRVMGPKVRLVDPARETVRELKKFLLEHPEVSRSKRREAKLRIIVSDVSDRFAKLASTWLHCPVKLELMKME